MYFTVVVLPFNNGKTTTVKYVCRVSN